MPKGKLPHICEHGIPTRDCPPCRSARQKAYYEVYCEKKGGKEVVNAARAVKGRKQREDAEFVESERARGREYWRDLRREVMMHYGGYVCACCGETEPLFLQLDHINNDGAEHRRSLGSKDNGKGFNTQTLRWIKLNGFPPGFQVLCANCNFGKALNGGVCPHQTKNLHKAV